jgi:hypothetical protein
MKNYHSNLKKETNMMSYETDNNYFNKYEIFWLDNTIALLFSSDMIMLIQINEMIW